MSAVEPVLEPSPAGTEVGAASEGAAGPDSAIAPSASWARTKPAGKLAECTLR